jgi:hypothetical protein
VVGLSTPIYLLGALGRDLPRSGRRPATWPSHLFNFSYAGRLTIAIRADADRFPDLPVLLAATAREWEMLPSPPTKRATRAARCTDAVERIHPHTGTCKPRRR